MSAVTTGEVAAVATAAAFARNLVASKVYVITV